MFERGKKEEAAVAQGFTSRSEGMSSPGGSRETGARDAAVIGRSIHINGDLRGEEDLRIEGDVSGTIQLRNSNLTIGKEGKIHADVYAKSITVDGTMDGDIYGSERVSIRATARMTGNVTAPRVSIEEGARFKGSIEMDAEAVEASFGKTQSGPRAASGAKPAALSTAKSGADKIVSEPEGAVPDTVKTLR